MDEKNEDDLKKPIDQFPRLKQNLISFLGIKREEKDEKSWIYRFFRYLSRPIRFVWRLIKSFFKWLGSLLAKVFRMIFLIPSPANVVIRGNKENVMLIKGEWGVGKTHLVSRFFKTNPEAVERYQPIFVDLFGLSSIDELNKKLIESISFAKTEKKEKSVKLYAKATLENKFTGLSASLEIGVLISKKIEKIRQYNKYVEQENAIYKKHKYRHIKEPVIILDDIERKNKELSLESIIGFVDIFKKRGIKTILIANAAQLELHETEMYHLLDRVVDKTLFIYSIDDYVAPLIERFQIERRRQLMKPGEPLFSASQAKELLKSTTCNLRTLKRFADVIVQFDRSFTYSDRALLNEIMLCLVNQCEGKYLFDDLIRSKTEHIIQNFKKEGEEKKYDEAYREASERYSSLRGNRFEIFYLQTGDLLNGFDVFKYGEGRDFAKKVFSCLNEGRITDLKNYDPSFSMCPLRNPLIDDSLCFGGHTANELKAFIETVIKNDEASKIYSLIYVCQACDVILRHFNENGEEAKRVLNTALAGLIDASVVEFFSKPWNYKNNYLYTPPKGSETKVGSRYILKKFFERLSCCINEASYEKDEEIKYVIYAFDRLECFQGTDWSLLEDFYMNLDDSFYKKILYFDNAREAVSLYHSLSKYGGRIKQKIRGLLDPLIENGTLDSREFEELEFFNMANR